MRLMQLRLERKTYGPDEGKILGKATFSGDRGEITLNLNEHHVEQMLLVCADGIVDVAKAAAKMFVQEALHGTEVARNRQLTATTVSDATMPAQGNNP
jgi:hypothetical protein